ncbi:MAG: hypothetical protein WC718_18230 [Phycisphaerales bacterium]|jgi:hypothetical protein
MTRRLLLALALLAFPGCACAGLTGAALVICQALTPDLTPAPQPPAEAPYVVTRGKRTEKTLTVPCSVEFSMVGKLPSVEDGGPRDNCHLAWAYQQQFSGGNPPAGGGYVAGVRDYALKVYHDTGLFAKQERYGIAWDPSRAYLLRFVVERERTALYVDGSLVAPVAATAPAAVTLGIGWPPEQRPGAEGAGLTEIVWTDGAAP